MDISFSQDALEEIAGYAERINQETENIGARRLYTLMEKVLADLSFDAPDQSGQTVDIDAAYVRSKLEEVVEGQRPVQIHTLKENTTMPSLDASDKARIITEALPFIKTFHGQRIVIKYGGHAMVDEELKKQFALNVIPAQVHRHPPHHRAWRRPADRRYALQVGHRLPLRARPPRH